GRRRAPNCPSGWRTPYARAKRVVAQHRAPPPTATGRPCRRVARVGRFRECTVSNTIVAVGSENTAESVKQPARTGSENMAARRRGRTPTVLPAQYAAILNEYAIALRRADMTVEGFRALRPSPRTSSATASVPTSSRSGIDLVTVAA